MTVTHLWNWVLEGAARACEGRPTVISSSGTLTFGDLIRGAEGVATTLRAAGVGRGDRVGLWMEKTPRAVQAILGTLAAGAVYVPIDPCMPWRRGRAISHDCGLAALVVDEPRLERAGELLEGLHPRILLLDSDRQSPDHPGPASVSVERIEEAARRPAVGLPSIGSTDLAYILYTSGSTGIPKGVVHTHGSGLAFARWVVERFAVTEKDLFSSHAPLHFDLSISDLYAALGAGAAVRLLSSSEAMLAPWLVRMIPAWGITVWYSVPSILIAMLDGGRLEELGLPGVRVLLFAGEVFPTPQLRRLRRALPHARLANLFGPTETNVCTWYEVPADIPESQTAPIPIGRACEHMETFVMNDEGGEAPAGVEGTLWATGPNLMQGYWNDPDRTTATLRPDPRGRPGVAYCTGDRVVVQPDGTYQFRGRRDHMVKIRGYRVELGEVESVLAAHPDVLEAVALTIDHPVGGVRLVASAVPRSGASPEPDALRAFLRQRLPLYMVPDQIEVCAELPRTSTGKADRSALRAAWTVREDT